MSTADRYTMKIKFLLILLLSNTICVCRGPRHNRQKKVQSKTAVQQQSPATVPQQRYVSIIPHKARLEGVECSLCAQAATKVLAAIDGINDVQISFVNEEAEFAEVAFMWQKNIEAFDLAVINKALDKEGFEMTMITMQKSIVKSI